MWRQRRACMHCARSSSLSSAVNSQLAAHGMGGGSSKNVVAAEAAADVQRTLQAVTAIKTASAAMVVRAALLLLPSCVAIAMPWTPRECTRRRCASALAHRRLLVATVSHPE